MTKDIPAVVVSKYFETSQIVNAINLAQLTVHTSSSKLLDAVSPSLDTISPWFTEWLVMTWRVLLQQPTIDEYLFADVVPSVNPKFNGSLKLDFFAFLRSDTNYTSKG